RFFEVADVSLEPKPVQKPHPPIVFGAVTQVGARRAARTSDGLYPMFLDAHADPGRFDHLREAALREAERAGRDLAGFRLYAFCSGLVTEPGDELARAKPRRPLGDDRGAARDRGAVRGGGPARGARHRGGAAPVKPPPFECVAVRTVEEAIAQLGDGGDDARVLAGGQSLVPMLNMRLARPATLVDVNPVTGLEAIEPGEALTLGALDGEVVAARADGERTVEASAFFLGPF